MNKIHLYDKILTPMVTEKSTNLSELGIDQNKNTKTFFVNPTCRFEVSLALNSCRQFNFIPYCEVKWKEGS